MHRLRLGRSPSRWTLKLLPQLRRALAPDGQPRWLWLENGRYLDWSPLLQRGDLAEIAAILHQPEAVDAFCRQAATVDGAAWPLRCPGRPPKALCLGKNFAAHAREFGAEPPEELVWFAKLPNVLIGCGETVEIPAWLNTRVDPEAELAVVIGQPLRNATPEQAEGAIAAWTLGNDVTARKQQGLDRDRGWPWLRCKNLATFGALGPGWIPADRLPDDLDLELQGRVNGQVRQRGRRADLLWPPGPALAEISRWLALEPGDVVFLGTPAGVSAIGPGDLLEVEYPGFGVLQNPVVQA